MKKNKAFTVVEVVVVLFIIGLISSLAALGFSKAKRQRLLYETGRIIKSGVSNARDYALFGQEEEGKYPCGYGLAVSKDSEVARILYVSSQDRITAMESDQTCDEYIASPSIPKLKAMSSQEGQSWTSNVAVATIGSEGFSAPNNNCAVVLFSAPRGGAYYCDCPGNCDFGNDTDCDCRVFSDTGDSVNENYYNIGLKLEEGILTDSANWRVFASGNVEEVQ